MVGLLLPLSRGRMPTGSAKTSRMGADSTNKCTSQLFLVIAYALTSTAAKPWLMTRASRKQGTIKSQDLKVSSSRSYVVRTTLWNLM